MVVGRKGRRISTPRSVALSREQRSQANRSGYADADPLWWVLSRGGGGDGRAQLLVGVCECAGVDRVVCDQPPARAGDHVLDGGRRAAGVKDRGAGLKRGGDQLDQRPWNTAAARGERALGDRSTAARGRAGSRASRRTCRRRSHWRDRRPPTRRWLGRGSRRGRRAAARARQQLIDQLIGDPAPARQLADRGPHPRAVDRIIDELRGELPAPSGGAQHRAPTRRPRTPPAPGRSRCSS